MATLYAFFGNGDITEEMRRSAVVMTDTIRAATVNMEDRITGIEDSLALVRLDDAGSEEDAKDRASAIKQLEDITPLVEARKVLEELLPKAIEESIKRAVNTLSQSVSVSFGANYHGMQLGVNHGSISRVTFGRK